MSDGDKKNLNLTSFELVDTDAEVPQTEQHDNGNSVIKSPSKNPAFQLEESDKADSVQPAEEQPLEAQSEESSSSTELEQKETLSTQNDNPDDDYDLTIQEVIEEEEQDADEWLVEQGIEQTEENKFEAKPENEEPEGGVKENQPQHKIEQCEQKLCDLIRSTKIEKKEIEEAPVEEEPEQEVEDVEESAESDNGHYEGLVSGAVDLLDKQEARKERNEKIIQEYLSGSTEQPKKRYNFASLFGVFFVIVALGGVNAYFFYENNIKEELNTPLRVHTRGQTKLKKLKKKASAKKVKVTEDFVSATKIVNGVNKSESLQTIWHVVAKHKKVNIGSFTITYIGNPELTMEEVIEMKERGPEMQKVEVKDMKIKGTEGGQFVGEAPARVYISDGAFKRRIIAKAKITGAYDPFTGELKGLIEVSRDMKELPPVGTFRVEPIEKGKYKFGVVTSIEKEGKKPEEKEFTEAVETELVATP